MNKQLEKVRKELIEKYRNPIIDDESSKCNMCQHTDDIVSESGYCPNCDTERLILIALKKGIEIGQKHNVPFEKGLSLFSYTEGEKAERKRLLEKVEEEFPVVFNVLPNMWRRFKKEMEVADE